MRNLKPRPELLIVEDDGGWIDHYRTALKYLPLEISTAKSVKEANSLLNKRYFSCVIVDLELPGRESTFGGFEVIDFTAKRNPYTEMLVITGHKAEDALDRVSRAGIRYVTKPVDDRELSISVNAMISAWERRFADLQSIVDRFAHAALILQERSHKKPGFKIKDEYDVQDLMHFLYKPLFPDVVTEEYTLKRAGKTKRLDLVFKGLDTVIETKMVRSKAHAEKISDELDIDIRGYAAHPHCRRLICYVYDPKKFVKDENSIEDDLSGEQAQNGRRIDVTVMIRRR